MSLMEKRLGRAETWVSQRGKGHVWKWFSTLDSYWSEPRLGGSRDCPHVGSVLVVLTVAGAATFILLLLWDPGAPRRDVLPWGNQGFREPKE